MLLEMNHIRKAFPGVVALSDVSITVERGEVLALLGENGAGKSTLIKVLAGVHEKDKGTIAIDGKEYHFSEPKQALEAGVAVIYQELCLAPDLSVAENIFIGRVPKNKRGFIDEKTMYEEAQKILDDLTSPISPYALVKELTIAQQQIVEIAKCMSFHARIIVMDEPTSSLTSDEVEKLFELIARLKKEGMGIIYISHKMDEIFKVADRVTVIRDGSTVGTREIGTCNQKELIGMMVGRPLEQYYIKENNVKDEVVLEVKDFVTTYTEHKLNFSLKKGEILGFSGLIGAGRSELMRAIFGVDKKVQGEVFVNGRKADIRNAADAIENRIAMVSEDRKKEGLILHNNIGFNISILSLKEFISGCRVNRKKEKEIIDTQIKALNIKTFGHHQLAVNLSGGNQQKVVLAKWLAIEPQIIIMDEPTRGIDIGAKAEIYEIMNRLTRAGHSIIVVSSELPEIINMCDRVVVMMEGAITAILNRDELTQEKIMYHSLNKEGQL